MPLLRLLYRIVRFAWPVLLWMVVMTFLLNWLFTRGL